MAQLFANAARSTLTASITSSSTQLQINPADQALFPVATGADWFKVALEDSSGNLEYMRVQRAVGQSLLTITERATEDATKFPARAFAAGSLVELRMTAADLASSVAHPSANTGAHAASAISVAPGGDLGATNVQAALLELDSEKASASAMAASLSGKASTGANTFSGDQTLPSNATAPLHAVPLQQVSSLASDAANSAIGNQIETYRGTDSRIAQLPPTTYLDNAYSSMLAKLADGRLVGWGRGTARNLGTGNNEDGSVRPSFCQFAPRIPDGVTIAGFTIGSADSFAWLSNGWVYHSGLNTRGVGGHGDTAIRPMFTRIQFFVTNSLSVSDVQLTSHRPDDQYASAVFLCANGDVYCSGHWASLSGSGSSSNADVPTPVKTLVVSGAVGITRCAGDSSAASFAWNSTGKCWAWGVDYQGLLGVGSASSPVTVYTPVEVPGTLVSKVVSRISMDVVNDRYGFTLFLLKDGTVKAAGYNFNGNLGDGTNVNRNTPSTVSGLSNIVDIGAGGGQLGWGWAVTASKQLWMWGFNGHGGLGVGDTTNRTTPVQPVGWFDEADTVTASGAPPFQGKVAKVITGKTVAGGPLGRQVTGVLDEDGNVWIAGYNDGYTCGWNDGAIINRFKRVPLMSVQPGDKIVDIHYQGHSTNGMGVRLFALTQRGRLLGSGLNSFDLITALPNTSPTNYRAVFLQPVRLGV